MMAKPKISEKEGEYFLYAWGANSYGQLGTGNKEDTFLPSKCQLAPEIVEQLIQLTGGGGHTVLVTGNGELYVCGWNKNGQLGCKPLEDVTVPRLLTELPVRVAKVACGWNHTLALSEAGELCVWGSNSFGQLGVPQIDKETSIPTMIPHQVFANSRVKDISAGLRHSLAATEDGAVYSWGDGKKGQLGLGKKALAIHKCPTKVETLPSCIVAKVACGMYHSLAITVDGELFSWGQNQYGECGLGELTPEVESLLTPPPPPPPPLQPSPTDSSLTASHFKTSEDTNWIANVYTPWMIQSLPPIESVHCGWNHSVAVCSDGGAVYCWGRSGDGRLGLDESCSIEAGAGSGRLCCCRPTELQELRGRTTQVACGSAHNIVIGKGGEAVTFGWNEHGMCGNGSEESVLRPRPIGLSSVVAVGTGVGMTMAVI